MKAKNVSRFFLLLHKPHIITATSEKWCEVATSVIATTTGSYINNGGDCSLMLTGGNTAKLLYGHWVASQTWEHRNISYFFGDERCVPPEHPESNYGMVKRTLFPDGIPENCAIKRMEGEASNRELAARNYEQILPESLDILLLALGPDGHIASLFPGSPSLSETTRSVIPIIGPKPPPERLTITPCVIQTAKSIFLLIKGKEKGQILAEALKEPDNINSLPVRLLLDSTWILDSEAADSFNRSSASL